MVSIGIPRIMPPARAAGQAYPRPHSWPLPWPGGIVTFAIFLADAFVAACITGVTGFAFGLIGAAI